ncbi:alpha/beta hydrolase [Selenihalanaerobacter shriftii]|uniref:Acetyl esterase/lipase n=1 Tax=Selenihalanaerobacter shriftii TaxID=142842 RepID=A0A1T4LXS0_9FIRM|nr:alpha/beta hydrolase [Selenihalanaerobacter shriftii]SJZ59472.1 Acetyl esterase/lipase [Selenihalanaerobacter shriftii]
MVNSMSTYIYKEVNNLPIHLNFYSSNIKNSPVIVYIHGGALIWGSRKDIISKQVDLYNEAGYSVISLDYRLAPETKLEYIIEDINDALIWIKENGQNLLDIDTNKIALVGSSAGSYLSLLTGTFDEKPNTIVSFYGYGDILADWYVRPSAHYCKMPSVTKEEAFNVIDNNILVQGDRERYIYYVYCRQNGIWTKQVSGYNIIEEKEEIIPFCPIYNLDTSFPPTLLIHGDNDTDVPYEQSLEMSKRLNEYEVYNRLITVKGKGHAFDYNMSNPVVKDLFKEVVNFLNSNI